MYTPNTKDISGFDIIDPKELVSQLSTTTAFLADNIDRSIKIIDQQMNNRITLLNLEDKNSLSKLKEANAQLLQIASMLSRNDFD